MAKLKLQEDPLVRCVLTVSALLWNGALVRNTGSVQKLSWKLGETGSP